MSEVFRFLDLPKELRLMVYEFLPEETQYLTIHNAEQLSILKPPDDWNVLQYDDDVRAPSITFVPSAPRVSAAILLTCRLVNDEAKGIVQSEVEWEFPKIIVHADMLPALVKSGGFFDLMIRWRDVLASESQTGEPLTTWLLGQQLITREDVLHPKLDFLLKFLDLGGRHLQVAPDNGIRLNVYSTSAPEDIQYSVQRSRYGLTGRTFMNLRLMQCGIAELEWFRNADEHRAFEYYLRAWDWPAATLDWCLRH